MAFGGSGGVLFISLFLLPSFCLCYQEVELLAKTTPIYSEA